MYHPGCVVELTRFHRHQQLNTHRSRLRAGDSPHGRHGTGSHFVTQRPSDTGIQRPGDPVDPVTLFYNELRMSTYVADKRLQWERGLPVSIAVWRLHASGKLNFEDHLLNVNISMTVGRIFAKIYIFISLSWDFIEKRKNLGLTPGQNDDPVTRTLKMTQMTQFHA